MYDVKSGKYFLSCRLVCFLEVIVMEEEDDGFALSGLFDMLVVFHVVDDDDVDDRQDAN